MPKIKQTEKTDRRERAQQRNQERDTNMATITEAVVTILNNPFTPDTLFNAIFEEILEISNAQGGIFNDPDVLRVWLPKAMRKMVCS